jgi:hypothetical protein
LKQRQIQEERNPQLHYCEKLKTRKLCCSSNGDDCGYCNGNGKNGDCDSDVGGGGGDVVDVDGDEELLTDEDNDKQVDDYDRGSNDGPKY